MSDDLVKRLRKLVDTEDMHPLSIFAETIRDAADAIERLTKERDEALSRMSDKDFERTAAELRADAAIARAEAAETALRATEAASALQGYGVNTHAMLQAGLKTARELAIQYRDERDTLRALLIETRPFVQDSVGFTHHELRARIAAATGDDNGQ